MASSSKLVFEMGTTQGKKNYTVNYANSDVESPAVRALAAGFVTNSALFDPQPLTCNGAKLIVTEETVFDIS